MEAQHSPSLFGNSLKKGGRTHYLDVKKTQKGKPYVSLNQLQTRTIEGKTVSTNTRLIIFEEEFLPLLSMLKEAEPYFTESQPKQDTNH